MQKNVHHIHSPNEAVGKTSWLASVMFSFLFHEAKLFVFFPFSPTAHGNFFVVKTLRLWVLTKGIVIVFHAQVRSANCCYSLNDNICQHDEYNSLVY